MFGKVVEPSAPILISIETLARTRLGIKRRINREMNWMAKSVDIEYIQKRRDNVRRLRIIKRELSQLERELYD